MGIIVEYISTNNGVEVMPAYKTKFDHKKKVNRTDRQICCNFCHNCHREAKEVLDGELWCGICQEYL